MEHGYNGDFINQAESIHKSAYQSKLIQSNFYVKYSFNETGLNAVVVEGLIEHDLRNIKGFKYIHPDLPVNLKG